MTTRAPVDTKTIFGKGHTCQVTWSIQWLHILMQNTEDLGDDDIDDIDEADG